MAPIVPPQGPTRYDTRGLPEGYDPHKLYEYRFEKLGKEATGIEWLLYKYIPYSVIKSFAMAIDPTSKFKVAPGVITPANRNKYRATASVLQRRRMHNLQTNTTFGVMVNYQGIGGCRSKGVFYNPPSRNEWYQELSAQEPLPDTLSDTTKRTRLMGSERGTLTLFKGYINSPSRSVRRTERSQSTFDLTPDFPPTDPCMVAGGTFTNKDGGIFVAESSVEGPAATLSYNNFRLLKESEINRNIGLMQTHATAMLKEWTPSKRVYTFARNLVELRDIPRSVASLRTTIADFRQLYVSLTSSPKLRRIIFDVKETSKDIPGEYLSFHFGWKQTWKDIIDLLGAPEKYTKQVNFLMSRSGKPTTFRVKRTFVSGDTDVPGFGYDVLYGEDLQSGNTSSRIERTSELRLVVNATIDFPRVSGPLFQLENFLKQTGVIPRPTDLYNLIPWTWLVDWFSGLGNYIECIDTMNSDPHLINWGMLTCVTTGRLVTDFKSTSRSTSTSYYNNVGTNTEEILGNRHTSMYNFTCETRRDVSTILDVKTTSNPDNLTPYQKSIIGALLAQRLDFTRKAESFRPRT